MIVGRDMMKKRKLRSWQLAPCLTTQRSTTDQKFILLLFPKFVAEDRPPRCFQRLDNINLGEDVRHSFVIYLRRLEDCIDDRLIGKDDVTSE